MVRLLRHTKVTGQISDDRDHPNTISLDLWDVNNRKVCVTGESTGGGSIHIDEYDSIKVSFTTQSHTLLIPHKDAPGEIAAVTGMIASCNINIGQMNVYRTQKGSTAVMIIETDQLISDKMIKKLKLLPDIHDVIFIKAL